MPCRPALVRVAAALLGAAACASAQAVIADLITPLAGSLGAISGRVTGLVNPAAYKACVYLESGVASFNGPKVRCRGGRPTSRRLMRVASGAPALTGLRCAACADARWVSR